jgi:hypothetical protein
VKPPRDAVAVPVRSRWKDHSGKEVLRMAKYSRDPRWITARFPGRCKKCGKKVETGGTVYYLPVGKAIYCKDCGEEAARRFVVEAMDDENNRCM